MVQFRSLLFKIFLLNIVNKLFSRFFKPHQLSRSHYGIVLECSNNRSNVLTLLKCGMQQSALTYSVFIHITKVMVDSNFNSVLRKFWTQIHGFSIPHTPPKIVENTQIYMEKMLYNKLSKKYIIQLNIIYCQWLLFVCNVTWRQCVNNNLILVTNKRS